MTYVYIYFAFLGVMSIITFFTYMADKRKAERGEWRIKEVVLLGLGLFGGAWGALLAMQLFRHKTRHWYFWVENIVAVLLQAVAATVIYIFCV